MDKTKLIGVLTLLGIITLVALAIAGPMTWSTALPSPTDATIGYNQQAVKNAAALTELRNRVKAMGIFAGYTTQGN
jgi:hypothetical protein